MWVPLMYIAMCIAARHICDEQAFAVHWRSDVPDGSASFLVSLANDEESCHCIGTTRHRTAGFGTTPPLKIAEDA